MYFHPQKFTNLFKRVHKKRWYVLFEQAMSCFLEPRNRNRLHPRNINRIRNWNISNAVRLSEDNSPDMERAVLRIPHCGRSLLILSSLMAWIKFILVSFSGFTSSWFWYIISVGTPFW